MLAMLDREATSSTIAQSGAKVLKSLLNKEGQRRSQRGLLLAKEDYKHSHTLHSEAPSLKGVVDRIASASSWQTQPSLPGGVTCLLGSDGMPNLPAGPVRTVGLPLAVLPQLAVSSAIAPSPPGTRGDISHTSQAPTAGLAASSYASFGDPSLGGDESEDLLRSLGFFEVGNATVPVTPRVAENPGDTFSILSGGGAMAQDLSWLDGLGEW